VALAGAYPQNGPVRRISRRSSRPIHFTPLSFAENMAAMVSFGLVIALEARSQLKVEKS
jgi:hypothetical protein